MFLIMRFTIFRQLSKKLQYKHTSVCFILCWRNLNLSLCRSLMNRETQSLMIYIYNNKQTAADCARHTYLHLLLSLQSFSLLFFFSLVLFQAGICTFTCVLSLCTSATSDNITKTSCKPLPIVEKRETCISNKSLPKC